ncbi:MFS transporter [Alteraurantiacibacter aestuarii]|uniref:MFS transporter n=1 Tax=Alteraurantiacibacter aestuarii TaxID=650004 RepID=A0A844ZNV6_9SPHN|nr:MFS transporter [Alteraurantiacibacter aestuarii]MXO88507.1 MFS transporter [Alteraurantiacibacter aestuarii]
MSENKGTKFPRGYELTVLLLLGLAYGFAYFDRMSMTFLGPAVQADMGLSNEQLGWLGSGLSLTWALGAYFVGRWSDLIGRRKPFLIAALVIFSFCSMMSGLAWSFGSLLASRIVMGAAEGPFLPICLAIMVAASAESRKGLNAGIVQNVFGSIIGTALAPIVLVRIAEAYDWRMAFFLAGVPGLILAAIIWRKISEPEPDPATVAARKSAASLGIGALVMRELREMRSLMATRNILLCAIVSIFGVGTVVIGSIFMPLYLDGPRGIAPATWSNIMATIGFSPAAGAVLAGLLSERVGRKPALVLFVSLMMIAPATLLWVQGPAPMLAALLFVSWMGLGSFPLFMGIIPAETLGRVRAATAMGAVVAVGEIFGGFALPPITGRLADSYSLDVALYVQLGLAALGGLVALFVAETNPRILARKTEGMAA